MATPPKAMTANYTPKDPQSDLKLLNYEANQGLPVKGFNPTWEEGRPSVLPTGDKADKGRGFLAYERKPLPYRWGGGEVKGEGGRGGRGSTGSPADGGHGGKVGIDSNPCDVALNIC